MYYEELSKGCSIYADRPDICRVDKMYNLRYSHLYNWDEFIRINLHVCTNLESQDKIHHKEIHFQMK